MLNSRVTSARNKSITIATLLRSILTSTQMDLLVYTTNYNYFSSNIPTLALQGREFLGVDR